MAIEIEQTSCLHSITNIYPVPLMPYLEKVERGDFGPFDENGLPLVDYDRHFAIHNVKCARGKIGVHATPVTIALFGLARHALYHQHGGQANRTSFLNAADWFVINQVDEKNTGGVWLHHFPMPNLPPLIAYQSNAWISAMAQGLGISLLLRAYSETRDQKYLKCAQAAAVPFHFDIADGGVARTFTDGSIFFEEFPADPPIRVLNGAQFALLGLLEYSAVENDPSLHQFSEVAVEGMRRALPQFDLGYASLYDLRRRQVANAEYHATHIHLLDALAELANADDFRRLAAKWRSYRESLVKKILWRGSEYWWAMRRRFQNY